MPPRKRRVSVVLDTNVIVGFYLSRTARSATREIFRLWRDLRRLQLIVSDEIVTEYIEVLRRLQVDEAIVRRFRERLAKRNTEERAEGRVWTLDIKHRSERAGRPGRVLLRAVGATRVPVDADQA